MPSALQCRFCSPPRLVAGLFVFLLVAALPVSGQRTCPRPEGLAENPLERPSVTAAEVAANPTPDNLKKFAVAVRDYAASSGSQLELAYSWCLMRQEGRD